MTIILGDTTSGIPIHQAEELNIPLLPQIIVFGQESYRDDYEIDHETFLAKFRESSELPKTAAPPPSLYEPFFSAAEDRKQDVVIICPSSELSGTYRSAMSAANEYGKLNIYVIDSKTIGGGLATLLLTAKKWANSGMAAKDIVININKMVEKEKNYFVVETLEYLHKGGRIGGAQNLFGSILQIKPILTIAKGKVQPAETQRTKKKALSRLFELIEADFPGTDYGYLCVMHGDALSEADLLAEQIQQKYELSDVPVYYLPPAFMVHAGPGLLGVSYFTK
ncbi:MAG: DegV family protein [Anaerolineaceae bacterium]|nr:DegV family protein [Anaerolineaceae bacterium]